MLTIVALRKESVDRNHNAPHIIDAVRVALRKESVDRNIPKGLIWTGPLGRSPQGERG